MPVSTNLSRTSKPEFAQRIIDFTNPLTSGLVFAPTINEMAGPCWDQGPYRTGPSTNASTAPTWTLGQRGPQRTFDGTAGALDFGSVTPAQITTGPLTLMAWITHTGAASTRTFFSWNQGSDGYTFFLDSTHHLTLNQTNLTGLGTDSSTVPTNTLSQVAVTWTGATAKGYQFYVNGVATTGGTTGFFNGGTFVYTSATLRIGSADSSQAGKFTGDIVSVYIWNRALAARDIQLMYLEPYALFRTRTLRRWDADSTLPPGFGPTTHMQPAQTLTIGW